MQNPKAPRLMFPLVVGLIGLGPLLTGGPVSAQSFQLDPPAPAQRSFSSTEALGSYRLPTGPWHAGDLPVQRVEGEVTRTVWRTETSGLTTLQLLRPLREQLQGQGFTVIFECETLGCGGFDFRFATDVLAEPDMHVDLGDFRFLSATRLDPAGPVVVGVLVSRSAANGFIQVTTVGPESASADTPLSAADVTDKPLAVLPTPAGPDEFARLVRQEGSVALDDLAFESGSARLGAGDFPSLKTLAAYLAENPDKSAVLVGHTDASGSLAVNIALSKARASSVRDRLIEVHGVPQARVLAEGVGYLSPRASNDTPEGRAQNRRVEVMFLTSTQ
jgi:OOP family OmpA-OmpF porin